MHVGTNKPGTKLTRPVALWKRALMGLAGVGLLFAAFAVFMDGAGWWTLLPLVMGLGGLVTAFEKYETIG